MNMSHCLLVTGGCGFLGAYVVKILRDRGYTGIWRPRSRDFDLRNWDDVVRLYETAKPDSVIHLAAVCGGIGANRAEPGRFFYDNAIMGIQVMEYGRRVGVEKFVSVGTICSYPKYTSVPFRESDIWEGYPEETNAAYGLAKKMLLVQGQAYRSQYDFNAIHLLPVNLYGPGDNFNPETSHVIPALIRKCVEAKEAERKKIVLWGDGSPTREFLHVEDAAEGIVRAFERYDGADPINLGTGEEISIRELAGMISSKVGFEGELLFDTSLPNGQPRRSVDTTQATSQLGFRPQHTLSDGIAETVEWFYSHRDGLESYNSPYTQ